MARASSLARELPSLAPRVQHGWAVVAGNTEVRRADKSSIVRIIRRRHAGQLCVVGADLARAGRAARVHGICDTTDRAATASASLD